jgi:hypothetical protein
VVPVVAKWVVVAVAEDIGQVLKPYPLEHILS